MRRTFLGCLLAITLLSAGSLATSNQVLASLVVALAVIPLVRRWIGAPGDAIEAAQRLADWQRQRDSRLTNDLALNDSYFGFVSPMVLLLRLANARYTLVFRDELDSEQWRAVCTAARMQREQVRAALSSKR